MTNKQRLEAIVIEQMQKKCLDSFIYRKRAQYELIEINVQEKYDYFMGLYDAGRKFSHNKRNLLVPYLLGLCDDFDINKEPASEMKEYPDIDTDYLAPVREYLMSDYAPRIFGEGNIAHIGTYQTYVLKAALKDMARVFGLDRNEIEDITKQFSSKDDDGDALTWEKAEELYPGFQKWCEKYPDAADAAKHLHGRIRQMSQHAAGFVISHKPLEGFAPIVKNKKDESLMTAWPEGQTSQDLMEVGLIKQDFLSSDMQSQIVDCVGMVLKDCKLDRICAKDGGPNWSDDSYLNDRDALRMANKGDLRFIFQFDSDGMRRLVRRGGVSSFDDLVAYTSLYRPGTLSVGLHEVYCNRKNGKEEYEIHPLLKPYLERTYGVAIYQESVMQILHAAGGIPMRNAYEVVKAISKKKIEKFAKYKEQFIENVQQTLELDEDGAQKMWSDVESWSGYGFNKSVDEDTYVCIPNGSKKISCFTPGDKVYSINENGDKIETEVVALHDHEVLDGYEVTFDDGYSIVCTLDHKFLTEDGQIPLCKIVKSDIPILCDTSRRHNVGKGIDGMLCKFDRSNETRLVGCISEHAKIADIRSLVSRKIVRIMPVGKRHMYDLEVACSTHNFLLPNGIVTSNSHATAYSYQSARQLYLKAHHPLQFFCTMFNHIKDDEKRRDCKRDAESHGVKVRQVHINKSCSQCCVCDNEIYFGLLNIKFMNEELADKIINVRETGGDFTDIRDFLDRCDPNAKTMQALISLGAFDFEDKDRLKLWKYYEFYKEALKRWEERPRNFGVSILRYQGKLRQLTNDPSAEVSMDAINKAIASATDLTIKGLRRLRGDYSRSLTRRKEWDGAKFEVIAYKDFDPDSVKIEIKDEVLKTLTDQEWAQVRFYGFSWANPIDDCNEVEGNTFESMRVLENIDARGEFPIEGLILEVKEKTTKKGDPFCTVLLQDQNWETSLVYVWQDELRRFKNDLIKGNIVRMRVNPPNEKFSKHTVVSYPPYLRKRAPAIGNDFRVVVLRKAVDVKEPDIVIEKDISPVTLNTHVIPLDKELYDELDRELA